MRELIEQLKEATCYHHEILGLIGSAFINDHAPLPSQHEYVCFQELGAYLLNKLQQKPGHISSKSLLEIAGFKRWDTTDKVGETFLTIVEKADHYYLRQLDTLLNELINQSSLETLILNMLLQALAFCPNDVDLVAIRQYVTEHEPQDTLLFLIKQLNAIDVYRKRSELKFLQDTVKHPELKNTINILLAILKINDVSMAKINLVKENIETNYNWHQFNVDECTALNDFIIKCITDHNYIARSEHFRKHIDSIAGDVNELILRYCRDNSTLTLSDIQQTKTSVNQLLAIITSDLDMFEDLVGKLNDLTTQLGNDSDNKVSNDLIAIYKPAYGMISQLRKQLADHKEAILYLKTRIDLLENALPFYASTEYQSLSKLYLDYERRFAIPPQNIKSIMASSMTTYTEIKKSFQSLAEKFKSQQAAIKFGSTLYINNDELLLAVRELIKNLDAQSLQFELIKNKCMAFEFNKFSYELEQMKIIYDDSDLPHIETFNAARYIHIARWAGPLNYVSAKSLAIKFGELKGNLREMENTLVQLIEQRNRVLVMNSLSPARSKPDQRVSPQFATPQRKARKRLFSLFKECDAPDGRDQDVAVNSAKVCKKNCSTSISTPTLTSIPTL